MQTKDKRSTSLPFSSFIQACDDASKRELAIGLLFFTTMLVYLPMITAQFLNYDDPAYVSQNPNVSHGLTWKNIIWAFTTLSGEVSYWHPLTWISHQIDCQAFGLSSGLHHLVSLLLHALNAVLILLVFERLGIGFSKSLAIACLFAFHPLSVESVAWVSERKNLLVATFWWATIYCYTSYVRGPTLKGYLIFLGFFVCGALSKPSIVTLPCVLLLLDFWPLKRVASPFSAPIESRDANRTKPGLWIIFLEKAPLFAMAGALCYITIQAQKQVGAMVSFSQFGVFDRVANAALSYVLYLHAVVYPFDLAIIYSRDPDVAVRWFPLSITILGAISLLVVKLRHRCPYFLVGWLWFLGVLVPNIGLVQVGAQSMADRYFYVAGIGAYLIMAYCYDEVVAKCQPRSRLLNGGIMVAFALLMMVSHRQLAHWQDSAKVFRNAVSVNPDNVVALCLLGIALDRNGEFGEASQHLLRAARLAPNSAEVMKNCANHFAMQGQHAAAFDYYSRALKRQPDFKEVHHSLAIIFATSPQSAVRNGSNAIYHAERAITLHGRTSVDYLDALAAAHAENGDFAAASTFAREALQAAEAAGWVEVAQGIRKRMQLYNARMPFRQPNRLRE